MALTRIRAREFIERREALGRDHAVVRPPEVPEGSVVTVLRVPPELSGMRVDRFVQTQLKRTSRTRAAQIVDRGAYTPDARQLRGGSRVQAEQCILLWRAPWDERAPDVTIPILHEDDDLLAVDKPAGIPVHPTARYHKSTVVKLLEAARDGERLMLAHRLDRETSGVLLLSRTERADRHVKAQFARDAARTGTRDERAKRDLRRATAGIVKQYVALTWGAPEADSFRVDVPLELDPTSRIGVKMRVAARGEGLAAATRCEVVGRRAARSSNAAYALVRCTLETGRQHQIRVHLAELGYPVVGDKLYGPDEELFTRGADGLLSDDDRARLELERHALHAARLELDHPTKGERLEIEAPMPPDMRDFWDALEA